MLGCRENALNDEDDVDGKVPWRAVTLWFIAAAVGGMASYLYSHASEVSRLTQQQALTSKSVDDLYKRLEIIESTKTDKRFRSDDWDAQRKILDAEFRSVWKAIEDCKKPR